jgi:anti-anti-sigma regulatory factor
LMDLRLHMPRPDVVIVRVSGAVDPVTAPVLAALVGKQLLRMPHVVLDLGEVSVLGPQV